ncbi:MAG: transcription elongation factor GreA [Phycisphaerales bacterium]
MEILSPAEHAKLEQQLKDLQAQRPILATRIAEARALGDLKENADYHAAREEQGLNEAKIRELEGRLRTAQVASESAVPKDMVFLGAVVRLKDVAAGKVLTYKLVGQMADDESDDYIEVTTSSPMGVALMRARIGEVIRVDLPRGEKRFEIIEIVG